jgi:hypothetical protein
MRPTQATPSCDQGMLPLTPVDVVKLTGIECSGQSSRIARHAEVGAYPITVPVKEMYAI